MKIIYEAKSFYCEELFRSDSIKYELNLMYLKVNNVWRECDNETLNISFPTMIDKNKNRFFASTNLNNKTNKIRIYELDEGVPYEDRYVIFKNTKVYVQSLYDDNIMCDIELLDLNYVEIKK